MSSLTRKFAVGLAFTMVFAAGAVQADDETKAEKRAEIDQMAETALDELFAEHPQARQLYEEAAGYAAFSSTEVSAGIKAGGGKGVAVDKETNERTYMNMKTGGVSLGLGGQQYQLVMLFETDQQFDQFVNGQWQGDLGASAVAGESAAGVGMNFRDGVAVFPISEKGLLLEADLTGTKFSVDEKLNREMGAARTSDDPAFDDPGRDETVPVMEEDHIDLDEDPSVDQPEQQ